MAKSGTVLQPLEITAGVQPETDKTAVSTPHYTYTENIRFVNGIPEKIGGWMKQHFSYNKEIQGYSRSIYTEFINRKYYVVIGTNEKLYSLLGSELTNITPLDTQSQEIPNSLDTHYDTLSNNPFSAESGSSIVTVTDSDAERYVSGDIINISGATGFAGLDAADLNKDHVVRSVGAGTYTINVVTLATSTATGGGSSVIRSSGVITVNHAAHGQINGDRVKLSGAASTGGISDTDINKEFIIRNVTTDSFDVLTESIATSSVSGGGGSDTIYYQEIPDGNIDEKPMQGYGVGLYGTGLYGVSKTSSLGRVFPRQWYCDRYGNTIVMTAGEQSPVYQWMGGNNTAPTIIPNAPDKVNYAFISDSCLVVFGENGIENRITVSAQNDIEDWTDSPLTTMFRDDIEGAGRFISHVPVEDYNLIFTDNKTYSMRFIGLPLAWEIRQIDDKVGIIAPMARVQVNGMAFWMGMRNFYMFRGGTAEIVKANTQNESTCLEYVFGDLNWGQKSKIFAWFNALYQEVWFHYPSASSSECDRVVMINVRNMTWTINKMDRTAAEYPTVNTPNPLMINIGNLYKHELGHDADGQPLPWKLVSNKRFYGRSNVNANNIIPDSGQYGLIKLNVTGWLYPQSTSPMFSNDWNIMPNTEYVQVTQSARFNQYTWSGAEIDQHWRMGTWMEELQRGSLE